jgi:hypothetical protein
MIVMIEVRLPYMAFSELVQIESMHSSGLFLNWPLTDRSSFVGRK